VDEALEEASARGAEAGMSAERPASLDVLVEEGSVDEDPPVLDRPRGKGKQDLLAEIQKSYNEVITLVRKLDDHLDRHESRSGRLIEVAERLNGAMEGIERAEERHSEIVDAMSSLARAMRDGNERADGRHEAQLASLARIETVLEQCDATDRATRQTLDSLREGVDNVAMSHDRMSAVLERMHVRDESRDAKLEAMVTRTSTLMIWLVGICGVGVAAAVTIATIVAVKL
jgi:hypothetical protein